MQPIHYKCLWYSWYHTYHKFRYSNLEIRNLAVATCFQVSDAIFTCHVYWTCFPRNRVHNRHYKKCLCIVYLMGADGEYVVPKVAILGFSTKVELDPSRETWNQKYCLREWKCFPEERASNVFFLPNIWLPISRMNLFGYWHLELEFWKLGNDLEIRNPRLESDIAKEFNRSLENRVLINA